MMELLNLLKQCPLDINKWTVKQAAELRTHLRDVDLDIEVGEISDILKREALKNIRNASNWRFDRDPLEVVSQALTMGCEYVCLLLSVDESLPTKTRQRLTPVLAETGLNGAHYLVSCDPRIFEKTKKSFTAHLEHCPLTRSSIYKPQHKVINGLDGDIGYIEIETSKYYRVVEEGAYLEDLDHLRVPLPDDFDLKQPPDMLELERNTRRFQRMRLPMIDPGGQLLRERLYYVLMRFLLQKRESIKELAHLDLGCPHTTICALPHPAFGAHHRLGSRHAYIDNAHTLYALLEQERTKHGTSCGEPIANLSPEEVCKIAIPNIIASIEDGSLANIFLQENHLIAFDAGSGFPEYRGINVKPQCTHKWTLLPQAKIPLSEPWKNLIRQLDADEILMVLQRDIDMLRNRYPEEVSVSTFAWPSGCEYVLRGSIALLHAAVGYSCSPGGIGTLQVPYLSSPGAFWMCLELAAMERNYDYREEASNAPLPSGIQELLLQYFQSSFSVLYRTS